MLRGLRTRRLHAIVAAVAVTATAVAAPDAVAEAAVPPGFADTVAIEGLSAPTAVSFAPDGTVFVAEKSGIVKSFDSLADTSATVTVDLRDEVHNFWDRGLLGLAVDPGFPARPYVYALYSHDERPDGGQWGDQCPDPPGATDEGCVIDARLAKLTVDSSGVATARETLLSGWCQQYPSHSIGTVAFGADGALYVGAGDGASFNFTDYGQRGNPCGDPPEPAGTDLSPPDAKGGALRSQSPRRPADEPVTMDGTIVRVDPDTGDAMPGNPFAASDNPIKRRVIAYGMRNPFRFAVRPGTPELWVGDVGWNAREEINRIPDGTDGVAENFGWPCYEGGAKQAGYDGADLTVCESLYSSGSVTGPYFAYSHGGSVVADDGCTQGGSSISGIEFENGTSNYPDAYDGALFFSDASRGCIWAMRRGADGQPDPSDIVLLQSGIQAPVDLKIGPGGDLYYVALASGELRRISYAGGANRPPMAVAAADPTSGPAPLTVQFDGTGSADPDTDDTLSYEWDLDGDGSFDDATGSTASYTYIEQEVVTAGLRVSDPDGATDIDTVQIAVDEPDQPEPIVVIDSPDEEFQWRVGQTIQFTGRATDAQDGSIPADALDWRLTLRHCESADDCHSHVVRDFERTAAGSFTAPDHEYPSHLVLRLTATDSDGNTSSSTVRLDPRTVELSFTSSPTGADLTVGGAVEQAPFTRTLIVGSTTTISAPERQRLLLLGLFPIRHRFVGWSDGGSRTHAITAPESAATYQANYQVCLLWC